MSAAKEPEWKRLQRRVFTRWINMKLRLGRADVFIKEDDLVTSWGNGYNLVALIQALSGQEFPRKLKKDPKMRIHQVDQVNRALTFAFSSGVEIELKPSAENLVDGEERQVMGLIWAIMRSFLNVGDDEQLSVQDALLLWVNNQVAEYGLKARNFGKDWHSGLLFCALIHKYRPRLIGDWPPSGTPHENIKLAMDGAEKFFGLEQYLSPEDIEILDDKSLLLYVSEYYYGITGFQKVYQAAKRVGNLMAFTQENDRLRDLYAEKARKLRDDLAEAGKTLDGIQVDNTLAGAKRNIAEFQQFKDQKKAGLTTDYLACESIMNTLSERLASQNRPPYQAEEGCALEDLRNGLSRVDAVFAEHNNTLYAELARQVRLHKLNDQHLRRYNKLVAWGDSKQAYLEKDQSTIESSGAAKHAWNELQSFSTESKGQQATLPDWNAMGQELLKEHFELSAEVEEREKTVAELFERVNARTEELRALLDDALKRERFKDSLHSEVETFTKQQAQLADWHQRAKTELANEAESQGQIASPEDAQAGLDRLAVLQADAADQSSAVKSLVGAAEKIAAAEYKSDLSEYTYPERDTVTQQAQELADGLAALQSEAEDLKKKLEDDLAREDFKRELLADAQQHEARFAQLDAWLDSALAESEKPEVDSVQSAQSALAQQKVADANREDRRPALALLKELGDQITAAEYSSELSSYKVENAEEIQNRYTVVKEKFDRLDEVSEANKKQLLDELEREKFLAQLQSLAQQHSERFRRIIGWTESVAAALAERPEISNVADAQKALDGVNVSRSDIAAQKGNVENLRALGEELLNSKRESEYGDNAYSQPEEIQSRQEKVDSEYATLEQTSETRLAELTEALEQEKAKDSARLEFAQLVGEYLLWAAQHTEDSKERNFGETLSEVEAVDVAGQAEAIRTESAGSVEKITAVNGKLEELQVQDNQYTEHSLADVSAAAEALGAALDERQAAYEEILASKKAEDELCKRYADQAEALNKDIDTRRETITRSVEELEAQLEAVVQQQTEVPTLEDQLKEVTAVGDEIAAQDIQNNPHTLLSNDALTGALQQFVDFLNTKEQALKDQIETAKMKGITREQYEEIMRNFKSFDKDNSGSIDAEELKQCLYSLGENKSKEEIAQIMQEFGSDNHMSLEAFTDFMIKSIGDSNTKEQLAGAFDILANGAPARKIEDLENVFSDEQLEYLRNTAPKKENGDVDFAAWVEDQFSR